MKVWGVSFKTIGLLASIGRRTGVARILGFNFSGFFAWWLWRTIYLSKLPGLDKKVRVAFDWTLDLLFRKDVCAIHDLPLRANSMTYEVKPSWSRGLPEPIHFENKFLRSGNKTTRQAAWTANKSNRTSTQLKSYEKLSKQNPRSSPSAGAC